MFNLGGSYGTRAGVSARNRKYQTFNTQWSRRPVIINRLLRYRRRVYSQYLSIADPIPTTNVMQLTSWNERRTDK